MDEREAKGSALGARVLRAFPKLSWTDAAGAHERTLSQRVTVGSAPALEELAGLLLADAGVSRLHAELDPRPDGIWVRDLGSRTGTFLTSESDAFLVREARVPLGRTLRFGAVQVAVDRAPQVGNVELWGAERFGDVIGGTAAMREVFAELSRLAQLDVSVLIVGEPGTGKEIVARALHGASSRAAAPLVVAERGGAFAAAVGTPGFPNLGRTVLLEDVGELGLGAQARLFDALASPHARDVRVLSTTTRDLRRLVNLGAFHEDLYFRLAQAELVIPPLRERREDVVRLAAHFLESRESISPELVLALSSRAWLGNVRELRAFVDRVRTHGLASALTA